MDYSSETTTTISTSLRMNPVKFAGSARNWLDHSTTFVKIEEDRVEVLASPPQSPESAPSSSHDSDDPDDSDDSDNSDDEVLPIVATISTRQSTITLHDIAQANSILLDTIHVQEPLIYSKIDNYIHEWLGLKEECVMPYGYDWNVYLQKDLPYARMLYNEIENFIYRHDNGSMRDMLVSFARELKPEVDEAIEGNDMIVRGWRRVFNVLIVKEYFEAYIRFTDTPDISQSPFTQLRDWLSSTLTSLKEGRSQKEDAGLATPAVYAFEEHVKSALDKAACAVTVEKFCQNVDASAIWGLINAHYVTRENYYDSPPSSSSSPEPTDKNIYHVVEKGPIPAGVPTEAEFFQKRPAEFRAVCELYSFLLFADEGQFDKTSGEDQIAWIKCPPLTHISDKAALERINRTHSAGVARDAMRARREYSAVLQVISMANEKVFEGQVLNKLYWMRGETFSPNGAPPEAGILDQYFVDDDN